MILEGAVPTIAPNDSLSSSLVTPVETKTSTPDFEQRTREKIISEYPTLRILTELTPEGSVHITEQEEKILVEIHSQDGFVMKYTLKPTALREGLPRYVAEIKKADGELDVLSCVIARNGKEVNLLSFLQGLGVTMVVPGGKNNAAEIFSLIDRAKALKSKDFTRVVLLLLTSASRKEKQINMNLVSDLESLYTLLHEVGHVLSYIAGQEVQSQWMETDKTDLSSEKREELSELVTAGDERVANKYGLPLFKRVIRELGYTNQELKQGKIYSKILRQVNLYLGLYGSRAKQVDVKKYTKNKNILPAAEQLFTQTQDFLM